MKSISIWPLLDDYLKKSLLVLLVLAIHPMHDVLAQDNQSLENVFSGFNLESFKEFLQNPQSLFKQIGSEFETTTI